MAVALFATAAVRADQPEAWQPCGWGGGGYYYATVFHPAKDGVLYLAGDVGGVYKSEDHGRHWRVINNGLVNYGVFSLAVDRKNPQNIFAATEGGLCKSTDEGEHWKFIAGTDRNGLRITGEKKRSIRAIAVSPADGNMVFAASPGGKIYKSTDGGETWKAVFEKKIAIEDPSALRIQFGKINDAFFGGVWTALKFPESLKPQDAVGFGFAFKGDKTQPKNASVMLTCSTGAVYRSKNLSDLFLNDQWRDVVLNGNDFTIDPAYAKKNPDKSSTLPKTPDWPTVNRVDFSCSGALPSAASVVKIDRFFFAAAPADHPSLVTARDFVSNKKVQIYGNVQAGAKLPGGAYSVAVSAKDPSLVMAATADTGLIISRDGGETWTETNAPKKAACVTPDATDTNVIYGAFFMDGIYKSSDRGVTWNHISSGLPLNFSVTEIGVSPTNPLDLYAIGSIGWNGSFFYSHDGGKSWTNSSVMKADTESDPTLQSLGSDGKAPLSVPTNLAINPLNPEELYISANWRCCQSEDGGVTWTERDRGADISCIMDIRFSGSKTYVSAMDEGTFLTENGGAKWQQLWPLKYTPDLTGHNWRLGVIPNQGADRVIATCSPWNPKYLNKIILSEDSGKHYQVVTAGLPDYLPRANTMWGQGYARALAVDPNHPQTVYLGIDGDPTPGKPGGGIFKSEDGGYTWQQLANQPGSRRMFFGLMVDPTDSNRIYWSATGRGGGVYLSEDAGASWKRVFSADMWIFNVHVAPDGTVYCGGRALWCSKDHGTTWKALTHLDKNLTVIGIETDPRSPQTIWISTTVWNGNAQGGVYKTTDGGATWTPLNGNLPYIKPEVLRFNPTSRELWAGGVGLYRLKQ